MPSVSLPKGGGAIRGMGEKFGVNPATGSGTVSVPLASSPGRAGFNPQLTLTYDSGGGNGPFGFGWSLGLPTVTRKTDKGLPRYLDGEESDAFILSGAEDLVPVLVEEDGQWKPPEPVVRTVDSVQYSVQRYRPRIEGLFARIERWTNQEKPADTFWRSISKDNITTWYGKTQESRIFDPEDPTRVFSWLICESYDDKGNAIVYGYQGEDSGNIDSSQAHERNRSDDTRKANRYLKRIRYGNHTPYLPELSHAQPWPTPPGATAPDGSADWHFEVVLDYGEHDADVPKPNDSGTWSRRKDPFSSYRAGFEVRTYRLCQRVLMFHHFPNEPRVGADCLVRSTDFTYSYEDNEPDPRDPIFSFLQTATQSGYKRRDEGSYFGKSLPPLKFEYSQPQIQPEVQTLDDPDSRANLPEGLDGSRYQWVDLDGEGLSGILTEQDGSWGYKRNLSPLPLDEQKSSGGTSAVRVRFGPLETVDALPSRTELPGSGGQFLDLSGDGQLDLVNFDGSMPGFFERTTEENWEPFRPFTALPSLDWSDPNLKFVDLTGDGHADILLTEDGLFTFYPSLGEVGFGGAEMVRMPWDEERGPHVVFADGTQTVLLADLSGDGLSDIARVRNGETCYWPNLGYGRFGAKVTMDNAPRFADEERFDPRRIRLADIDGSGTTDLLYVGEDGVLVCFNRSGNSWAEPRKLAVFPTTDDLSAVQVTDLLGNGTACLVWSSPLPGEAQFPLRYVDLMGGQKPHLMVRTCNNLGAETRLRYAPSTRFYLEDKRAGRPWVTRLPYPVHVVERVGVYDWIGRTHFVTRYAYHHGYFDGYEREFRGFAMVEQWDTEEFAAFSESDVFPVGDNIDAASHVPPVHTKTWFHTGVYLGRDHISNFFAGLADGHDRGEYYREPTWLDDDDEARKRLLDDTVLSPGLTIEEEREACRALKGSMLRQEVYALDGTGTEDYSSGHPYTVTEQNFTIRRLQSRADNRYAVFFTHPREALRYHYERNPVDPRVGHALTLEVDAFGNVLKEAVVGYGRRQGQSSLQGDDRKKQEQTLITYTENRATTAIEDADDYRTPLPCETRTYELTGLVPGASGRFDFAAVDSAVTTATPIAYEASPSNGLQKRLIEHVRTLYRKDNLTGPLPLRQLQSLALPFETYKLAFTPGLLARVYRRPRGEGQQPENLPPDPANALGGQGADRGGYLRSQDLKAAGAFPDADPDDHWWIPAGRVFHSPSSSDTAEVELTHARQHFFLPQRHRDPFGKITTVYYDAYDLLTKETRDPLDNVVTVLTKDDNGNDMVALDYRVLQPWLLTDPNGNRAAVTFDALGMVVGTAVMGKDTESKGDLLDNAFIPDLDEDTVLAHIADPLADPHAILQKATTRLVYDLFAYLRTKDLPQPEPAATYTLARETHHFDLGANEETKVQHSFSYSDGFGREIQKKIQAEPGQDFSPRWVGSGWTVFNNKGKPVRQYEPFFSELPSEDGHRFEFGVQVGVSPILFYDPVERVVATLHPNHTYEKVVFDPWQQTTYDANDTVTFDPRSDDISGYVSKYFKKVAPQPTDWKTWHAERIDNQMGVAERDAAQKAAAHADTPTVAHLDALGRPFLTLAHNRFERNGATIEEKYATRVELDIEGNQRAVRDAIEQNGDPFGRIVMRYDYDMLGNRIRQDSLDAGSRWMLNDVVNNPIRAWDSRRFLRRMTYDELRRPTGLYVTENGAERLAERTVYGESEGAADNHRTRVHQLFDGAGILTSVVYDFKGNMRESRRDLLADNYRQAVDWAQNPAVNGGDFTSHTAYDALNRPLTATSPDGSVYRPTFNEANLLDKVDVNLRGQQEQNGQPKWTPFVANIDYDAKGQRSRVAFGNGALTTYDYDPLTFRLRHLKTTRPDDPDATASQLFQDATVVQDLSYTYDPVGNITRVEDDALQTVFHNNQQVDPVGEYTYDALCHLIEARGREHIGQTAFGHEQPNGNHRDYPFAGLGANPNDLQALRNYTERYEYDAVGNFEAVRHVTNGGGWTRRYDYEEESLIETAKKSNRLTRTAVGNGRNFAETYSYTDDQGNDAHGCMTAVNNMEMVWDFEDQLKRVDLGGGGTAYYVYDAAGQRVRKVIETQNGTRRKERIYLGGGFEVYREYSRNGATTILERESLHVMDDKQRIALVETQTIEDSNPIDAPAPLQRYQLGNHLGSASVELDKYGSLVSYEEYHSFGTTAFQAGRNVTEVSQKRYRYTGKERDEESGLYYHGARYYAPWFGRWVSCDPQALIDGPNIYSYTRGNPIRLTDPNGTAGQPIKVNDVVPYNEPLQNRSSIGLNPQKDHVISQGKQMLMNPNIDTSRQLTVVQETGKATGNAPAKPHTVVTFHDPQADVSEITRLRQLKPENWRSFGEEIVEPSVQSRYRAGYDPKSTNIAALDEIGSMFETDQPNRDPKASSPRLEWKKLPDAAIEKERQSLAAAKNAAQRGNATNISVITGGRQTGPGLRGMNTALDVGPAVVTLAEETGLSEVGLAEAFTKGPLPFAVVVGYQAYKGFEMAVGMAVEGVGAIPRNIMEHRRNMREDPEYKPRLNEEIEERVSQWEHVYEAMPQGSL